MSLITKMGGRRMEKDELETMLIESRIARVSCHNKDGTIHSTPVWYKYIDGDIVFITPDRGVKARNLKRNSNITILLDRVNPIRCVMIYGKAELSRDNVLPMFITICEKYMEKKERAKSFAESAVDVTNLMVTVKPERMVAFAY